MTALGLIETKGLLAAIEGADAMLKAANVRLLEKNLAGGGLVTISIAGEVAAVKAAVDVAVAAIRRIAGTTLVSAHVIARPDTELTRIIALKTAEAEAPRHREALTAIPVAEKAEQRETPARAEASATAQPVRHDVSTLKKMNVGRLRQLARTVRDIAMTRKEITSAAKNDLIDAIINAYRQIEE